jgi:hypothetical protein
MCRGVTGAVYLEKINKVLLELEWFHNSGSRQAGLAPIYAMMSLAAKYRLAVLFCSRRMVVGKYELGLMSTAAHF